LNFNLNRILHNAKTLNAKKYQHQNKYRGCGVVQWLALTASKQEAGVQILHDPVYEKRKATSLFFITSDNNCISCVIFVMCVMSISVVKISDSQS